MTRMVARGDLQDHRGGMFSPIARIGFHQDDQPHTPRQRIKLPAGFTYRLRKYL
ncbi:BQ2448_4010 [Microbotryum intermedium]|uniref:BQ2448_4010 protein n=1 Tax=Microbotryum intermedium TaxID=269621 RepID=A0A238FKE7_9BASI|nr:BQ2448_4010 [Microbotryum intermedium]